MTQNIKKDDKIYLDFNATTPIENEVLLEIVSALHKAWGNPSSCYENGKFAKGMIENARKQVANMISATSTEIIFTSGGTESNNIVLSTAVRNFSSENNKDKYFCDFDRGEKIAVRPHIISSDLEHDSIKLTLLHLAQTGQAEVTFVPSSHTTGSVDVEKLFLSVRPNTCLITVMLANNETGVIQPVEQIGLKLMELNQKRLAENLNQIHLHTDAAQAIGKIPVNVDVLNVHYLTIVGHKFYGPRIGALFYRDAPLVPMFYGGGQEGNIRPGTENTPMIVGLGKACDLVSLHLKEYQKHMKSVRDYLEMQLELIFPGRVHFNGKFPHSERLPNTCNVSILGSQLKGSSVLSETKHLEASIGAACHSNTSTRASSILLSIGVPEDIAVNAMRLSVGRHTTCDDVNKVVADIKQAVDSLTSYH